MPGYRRNAQFILDPRQHSTPLDRNQRARLMFLAEMLELRSKEPGKRCGALGQSGLQVLRVLLRFANPQNGLCDPSYTAIACATKLARATIAKAIANLERCGIIRVARRLQRRVVGGIVQVSQATSLYGFVLPRADEFRAPALRVQRAAGNSTQDKIKGLLKTVISGLAMKELPAPNVA
jgi:hypothetical protein